MVIRLRTWRGWITPGECDYCGSHRDWIMDGRESIFCSCQLEYEENSGEDEKPEPFTWEQIEIRPNTLEELTTAGYINWLDGPILSKPFMAEVDNITPVEFDKDPEHVLDLVTMIRDEEWFKPIIVDTDGSIIDGHNRHLAVQYFGIDTIPVQEVSYLE